MDGEVQCNYRFANYFLKKLGLILERRGFFEIKSISYCYCFYLNDTKFKKVLLFHLALTKTKIISHDYIFFFIFYKRFLLINIEIFQFPDYIIN